MASPVPTDVVSRVDELLNHALARGASDIHLSPERDSMDVRLRIDGLLEAPTKLPIELGRAMVLRLMVLAKLLTYRLDVPQEGRATLEAGGVVRDVRVAVIPTIHGLRCAVRLPVRQGLPERLEELGLPADVQNGIAQFAYADSGMILVCGPAGSGKTTTIYALLRHLATVRPDLAIVSLEDPVERELQGVSQIEVSAFGELTYERALRSIMRQDPQVLALGEVRDAATASLAVQAALSGHRLVCTLHASSPGGALARLLEMGIEPYQITSAVTGILNQRLLRRLTHAGVYDGRVPAATWTSLDAALRQGVLAREDATQLDARSRSVVSLASAARALVSTGRTDAAEVRRVLGPVL